jgi:hypothetical protein
LTSLIYFIILAVEIKKKKMKEMEKMKQRNYQNETNYNLLEKLASGIYFIQKLNQELKTRKLNEFEKRFSDSISLKYKDIELKYYRMGVNNSNEEIIDMIKFLDDRGKQIVRILKDRNLTKNEVRKLRRFEKIYNAEVVEKREEVAK